MTAQRLICRCCGGWVTLFVTSLFFPATAVSGAIRYVNFANSNATPPFITWTTAATNIQDAIDAATPGDEVIVTNGVYGRFQSPPDDENQVAVTKPLLLRSVNGPAFTIVECLSGTGVYLTNGAVLSGFTITNGSDSGVKCISTNAIITNCLIVGNIAQYGGGVRRGTLIDCRLVGNEALDHGGGAYESTLINCLLSGNTAQVGSCGEYCHGGGGAAYSILINCAVLTNSTRGNGGGVYDCQMFNCTLMGNSAVQGNGGGAFSCKLTQCLITGNTADGEGGGIAHTDAERCVLTFNSSTYSSGGGSVGGTLNNCLLAGNFATAAGAAYEGVLNNCTLVGNSGLFAVGGALSAKLTNSILFYNSSIGFTNDPNYSGGTLDHCCTTPLPNTGSNNISDPPLFVNAAEGNYRLQPGSPCIDAGRDLGMIFTNDLDGNPRPMHGKPSSVSTFDIGAFEFNGLFFTGITAAGNSLRVSWFYTFPGMKLQTAASLPALQWTDIPLNNATNWIELPLTSSNAFLRLVEP